MVYDYICTECGEECEINHPVAKLGELFNCMKCGGDLQRYISRPPAFTGPKSKPTTAEVRERSFYKREQWAKKKGKTL